MATATAHHYATVNPYTGEVVREFDSLDAAAVESVHRAFSAVATDAPVAGFAG